MKKETGIKSQGNGVGCPTIMRLPKSHPLAPKPDPEPEPEPLQYYIVDDGI